MAVIDFKSAGESSTSRKFRSILNEKPVGFKTPLRFGTQNDGIFSMHIGAAFQIEDNFRNLLLTNHGERLGKYDFGANLRELSLEMDKNEFDITAIQRIRTAINKWMPFISPRTFESVFEGNPVAKRVHIRIIYDVSRLGITGKSISVTLDNGIDKAAEFPT